MPAFGSFALLVALALSGYNLLAGAVALRQLATGRRSWISPRKSSPNRPACRHRELLRHGLRGLCTGMGGLH